MEKGVVFKNICKKHGSSIALANVSFSIEKGEFFSILGPSGCGKTTLLRILAGFDHPDSGQIFLDGVDITSLPPNRRPINTVFQNYALFPHLTIWENIAFGLRIAKHPESFIKSEVERMLHLIQMPEHAHKMPDHISGGQKQRVAIARALVNHPQVLLLDEPLAALDLKLRQKMLIDLDNIHDEVGITFIFVTHDQTEAMSVSDRIAVLHKGRLEQIGSPMQIYEAPESHFVADFIGDTNFLDGHVTQKMEGYSVLKLKNFPDIICYNDKQLAVEDLVHLSVRPEKIHISRQKPEIIPFLNVFEGEVDEVIYKGDHTHFGVLVGSHKISLTKQHRHFLLDETTIQWKDQVWIWWHADDGFILQSNGGEFDGR
ncbi:MAG: ABC transporter ATP-binding protein [Parachlamydiaceae bacterium]|nr:ABC transporter ATP-binding protein [Parachlamydiaceae bacterium]